MKVENQITDIKIPKKIYPDNIRDAIVEIRYDSDLPFEILLGLFFNAFDETFFYTARRPNASPNPSINPNQISIQIGSQHIFYNDKISIQALPESLVFTCLGGTYIGWDNYFEEIKKAANILLGNNTLMKFTKFKRVGVRYISDYPKQFLDDFMKIDFTFGVPSVKSDTYVFRTEFNYDGFRVILNLSHRLPIVQPQKDGKNSETISISSIDIDIIEEKLDTLNLEEVYKKIDTAHTTEKKLFFSMLKEEYLQTLKPEY